jgi:hypothetical protein
MRKKKSLIEAKKGQICEMLWQIQQQIREKLGTKETISMHKYFNLNKVVHGKQGLVL